MTHKKIDPLVEEVIQSMTDQLYTNHMNSITTSSVGLLDINNDIFYNHAIFNTTGLTMAEKEKLVKDTIDRMKLINMLSDDKKIKWLEEHPEDYVYVVEPSEDVRNIKKFKEDL